MRLAAGLDPLDMQVPSRVSPTPYFGLSPVRTGVRDGISKNTEVEIFILNSSVRII